MNAVGVLIGVVMVAGSVVVLDRSTLAGGIVALALAVIGLVLGVGSAIPLVEILAGKPLLIINERGICYGDPMRPIVAWHDVRAIRSVVAETNGMRDHRFIIDVRDLDAIKRRAPPIVRLRMLLSRLLTGSPIAISTLGASVSPEDVAAVIARHYSGPLVDAD